VKKVKKKRNRIGQIMDPYCVCDVGSLPRVPQRSELFLLLENLIMQHALPVFVTASSEVDGAFKLLFLVVPFTLIVINTRYADRECGHPKG